MKNCKFVVGLVIGIVCGLLLVRGVVALAEKDAKSNLYPLTAQVVEINREVDVVVCVDGAGNAWEFTECEDWQEGDFVSLLMNANGTASIHDDVIEQTLFGGCF